MYAHQSKPLLTQNNRALAPNASTDLLYTRPFRAALIFSMQRLLVGAAGSYAGAVSQPKFVDLL